MKNKRMLVMDDARDLRDLIAEYFEMFLYDVDTCDGFELGRAYVSETEYDVCILDNDADTVGAGEKLAVLIKDKSSKTKVVLITGKPLSPTDVSRIEKLVDVLLRKPVSLKTIKDNI